MNFSRITCSALLLLTLSALSSAQWLKQAVDTKASFRGLSVVNEKVIWASGTGGTVIRTIDGGKTWKVIAVPQAEKLDFRDIEAFDARTAYILSIGNGEASRIYKTVDGGESWKEEFRNRDEKAFFDAIACTSVTDCIAMSDPVNGSYLLARLNGAITVGREVGTHTLFGTYKGPKAVEGEAAFAASGTCLVRRGDMTFLVSGGNAARVFRSGRDGKWDVAETPIIKGTPGSGIFSIAMWNDSTGVIVGGDYEKPDEAKSNLAFTSDGGITWRPGTGLTGYRSAVAYIDKNSIIAVGTNGTDLSRDRGKTWKKTGNENLNAVAAQGKSAVWAVGPNGLVVKLKR